MSRGNSKAKKHHIAPDKKYSSVLISRFINYIMLNGKKTVAEEVVYEALQFASEKIKAKPEELFEAVIRNVSPMVEVRGKRIGGANYQVPVEVSRDRKNVLAMRWVIDAARAKKGKKMAMRLADEFISAFKNEGAAIKKKEDTHRMAEANKAFAHFARL